MSASPAWQGPAPQVELLQSTLDALAAHIAVLDADGEIIFVNDAWDCYAQANGGVASEAPGGNYLAVCDAAVDDECSTRTAAGLRAIIAGTASEFTIEYPCHGPDSERWFKLRANRGQGSGPARVVVVHDDITDRRLAEIALTRQATLLDDVDASVISIDLAGRVIGWNDAAERMYGWSPEEAMGRRAVGLATHADRERAEEMIEALRLEGRWDGEIVSSRKDGSTFSAYVRSRVTVDALGRVTG